MYRCGILLKNGNRLSQNFYSKDECETYILEIMDKEDIKKTIIVNQENVLERYTEDF